MTPLSLGLGIGGLVLGFLADRLSVRWPAHEPPFDPGRRPGWRTVVVAAFGGGSLALLAERFGPGPDLLVFGIYVVALIVLLATDLDQRLLPDVVTLSLAGYAFIVGVTGLNPFVERGMAGMVGPIVMAVAVPLAVYLPSIPWGPGALGLGDVKLLVSMGLLLGFPREIVGLFGASVVLLVVIVLLLVVGRIRRRSYVPFGPFLILGAVWAVLAPATPIG